jgi:hypothetical protein
MKNINKYFLSLVTMVAAFVVSCSDDESKLAKQMIIDGEKEVIVTAYAGTYGADTDDNGNPISYYEIIFTASDLELDVCGDPSGTGSAAILGFYSPSTYKLSNGTYEIAFDEDIFGGNAEGFVFINYNADTEEADDRLQIVSGKIAVSRSGKAFRIKLTNLEFVSDFDGSEYSGKGSWEGEMTSIAINGCGGEVEGKTKSKLTLRR